MSRPQINFEPYPNPKNCPLGPPKLKKYPKIKSKSKVRIEGTIETKSYQTTWVDPKTVFEPYPDHKNSPFKLKKSKMTPKSSQNQKLELKKT